MPRKRAVLLAILDDFFSYLVGGRVAANAEHKDHSFAARFPLFYLTKRQTGSLRLQKGSANYRELATLLVGCSGAAGHRRATPLGGPGRRWPAAPLRPTGKLGKLLSTGKLMEPCKKEKGSGPGQPARFLSLWMGHPRSSNITLSQRDCSAEDQAIGGCAGQVRVEANRGLRDGELAGQGAVELGVEHLLDLLIVAVDGESDQPAQNLQVSLQHMHDKIAVRGRRGHRGDCGADVEAVPEDV